MLHRISLCCGLVDVSVPVVRQAMFSWGPVVVYMFLIFVLSSQQRPLLLRSVHDAWLHGAAYFILTVLTVRAFSKGKLRQITRQAMFKGVSVSIIYGASDEWHQSWVVGRVGSWLDLYYDIIGALLAVMILYCSGTLLSGDGTNSRSNQKHS